MEPDIQNNLEAQIAALRARVWRMERALEKHGISVADEEFAAIAPPPVLTTPANNQAEAPQVDLAPAFTQDAAAPAAAGLRQEHDQDRSLESRIGSQWFNRIGIVAVLIAVAWFLKLAIDNQWIGETGRVLIGLLAGAGLIAWSERFRSRGYTGFSYSLKAVGSGILYLSLWAAFSLFHLIPSSAAFAAMILVTAFNGFMSWIQDAELLALYAIAGGLTTPLLLSEGGNHEVTLFSYLLLLDLAVLILVVLRPWSRLLFTAFAGTVVFVTGWWFEYYSDGQAWRTALFLAIFFLAFALAPRLIRLRGEGDGAPSAWDNLALVLMPVGNAALGFLAFYAILYKDGNSWAPAWLAVAFAAFYLLLLRLPVGVFRAGSSTLNALHLALAIVSLTLALPLKAHGRWLTIGWIVEGAALLWVAERTRSALLRILSLICLLMGLYVLVAVNTAASLTPVYNERFGTYCVAIAAFAFVAWTASHSQIEEESEGRLSWPAIAAGAVLVINALVLLAIGWEIHSYWWYLRWHGNWALMHDYTMYAHFTYSALFMMYGALLLVVGFWKRSAFVRWQALVLVAVTIGKVFLVDISQLSQGYRILSFLGLGILLLAVSFVYQRDWLNLRNANRQPDRPIS